MTPTQATLYVTYGSGEYQLDREKLTMYRRLAAIHGETEVGHRYLDRASEVAERIRAFDQRMDAR